VSKALCPSFDTLAITVGILFDAGVNGLVVGEVHLDLLAGRDEVDDVGRRELVSHHDHELVLREDLNERRDAGLRLLQALEVESDLSLWDWRGLFGTFWRHRDGPRGVFHPEYWSGKEMAGSITDKVFLVEDVFRIGNSSSAEGASSKPRQPSLRGMRKEHSASGCRARPSTYHFQTQAREHQSFSPAQWNSQKSACQNHFVPQKKLLKKQPPSSIFVGTN
jgi:hypothetical protein